MDLFDTPDYEDDSEEFDEEDENSSDNFTTVQKVCTSN